MYKKELDSVGMIFIEEILYGDSSVFNLSIMAQMSIIFVCVFIAVISFSEASRFGLYGTQMMPGFEQMGMPGFGMPSPDMMMNLMMPPMMPPKPPQLPSKMRDIFKLHEKMHLEHLKEQAKQRKLMLEHQKMLQAAMMAALAQKPKPKPVIVVEKPKSKSSKSKSNSKSNSKKSISSKRSKSASASASKEFNALKHPGQMLPLTPGGLPGNKFQSVSYSTSSSSSNVNGVPSATQNGQMIVNDNGKVTAHVF